MQSCRWSIVWEDRIGVIFFMVNSCRDGLGIIAIAVSYDTRYARIRFDVLLGGSVSIRVHRWGVLVGIYFRNVSGVIILRGVI